LQNLLLEAGHTRLNGAHPTWQAIEAVHGKLQPFTTFCESSLLDNRPPLPLLRSTSPRARQ
jgi:hypothetical protein